MLSTWPLMLDVVPRGKVGLHLRERSCSTASATEPRSVPVDVGLYVEGARGVEVGDVRRARCRATMRRDVGQELRRAVLRRWRAASTRGRRASRCRTAASAPRPGTARRACRARSSARPVRSTTARRAGRSPRRARSGRAALAMRAIDVDVELRPRLHLRQVHVDGAGNLLQLAWRCRAPRPRSRPRSRSRRRPARRSARAGRSSAPGSRCPAPGRRRCVRGTSRAASCAASRTYLSVGA